MAARRRRGRACRVCHHRERGFIEALLAGGVSPRSLCRRVGGITREDVVFHMSTCVNRESEEA